MSAPTTMDGQPEGAWVEVLDQLEVDVVELDAALASGDVVPLHTWVPPRDLGPLPEALQPRAQRIAARIAQVQQHMRERLGELSAELQDVDQRRRAGSAYAS
ncbi:flagellar protein FliT [Egicoccus sp. AB-alg2]|uniref:flagellar protein FliT n=1 Tax=Egicoccus sp. AB-alg2 TaxID=3242693 RepID=UPI00359D280A